MKCRSFLLVAPAALIACSTSITESSEDEQAVDGVTEEHGGDIDDATPGGADFTNGIERPDRQPILASIVLDSGAFMMGAQHEESGVQRLDEIPHEVELTGEFTIGETEVTSAQFAALMGYDPTEDSVFACGGDCPVHLVGWDESAAFSNAMSAYESLEACYTCEGEGPDVDCVVAMNPYDCEGYRLPTEAEWEYAARAGEAHLYPGSDEVGLVGWFQGNSSMDLWPVAQLEPNAWGLYDMGGNIREFVNDWHVPQTDAPQIDPYVGIDEGEFPVEKGGSFACIPEHLEPNTRYMHMNGGSADTEYLRDVHVGFRVARSVHR